ncbi:MAG: hypothetical protein JW969_06110 [Spirochaetales bacterium]|nr:hypothetical protein [Spirochaetales bacterium]
MIKKIFCLLLMLAVSGLIAGCVSSGPVNTGKETAVFFDDFTYSGNNDPKLADTQWTIRTRDGGPGVAGCSWTKDSVDFVADPDMGGNQLLVLKSSTDGTPANTVQAEFHYVRKFYEGTYASRVYFTDEPASGPDGDSILQTFFTISHLQLDYPLDPDYSEMDFEYLPNGGWGDKRAMDLVTWETYQEEPWIAKNQVKIVHQSYQGWHKLVMQVWDGKVKYYIDGKLMDTHGGENYPESRMGIHFNQWFINGGLAKDKGPRVYRELVDYVFYAENAVLMPEEVDNRIKSFRGQNISFTDTVPAYEPPPKKTPPPAKKAETEDPDKPRPYTEEVGKVSGIKIDGNLNDWKSDPFMILSKDENIVYKANPDVWEGPRDFSVKLYAGWNEGSLHLAAEITDNQISQDAVGEGMWAGDYLELQFDAELAADYSDDVLSDDDFQLGFSPGNFTSVPKDLVVWVGEISEKYLSSIKYAIKETAVGYNVELEIPSGVLKGLVFEKGAVFGMNINPSDCDSPDQPQKLMMSTSIKRSRTNPTTYGKIILVD